MPDARENHRHPMLVASRDALGVLDAPAGLDHEAKSGLESGVDRVTERKKSVAHHHRIAELLRDRARPGDRERFERLDAVGLTLARSDQLERARRAWNLANDCDSV